MNELTDIQLDLVSICQMTCHYCEINLRKMPTKFMDKNLAFKILKEFSDMGGKLTTLHAVGESLIHPDIIEIMEFSESLKPNHRLSTNCFNLKGKISDAIRKLKKLQLILAIPWPDREAGVNRCVDNAVNYLNSKPENHEIHVQMVCSIESEKWYRKLINTFLPIAKEMDNVKIHLKQPVTWPDSPPNYGFINYELDGHPKIMLGKHATPVSIGRSCSQPDYLLQILADGSVVCCCVSTESQPWNLPKVTDSSLKDIWESARMTEIRKLWKQADDSLPCGHCIKRTDC